LLINFTLDLNFDVISGAFISVKAATRFGMDTKAPICCAVAPKATANAFM